MAIGLEDREVEDEHGEDTRDDEPSLGAFEQFNLSRAWKVSSGMVHNDVPVAYSDIPVDAELDATDDEPSLGSNVSCYNADTFPQSQWGIGARDDREHDDSDEEPSLGSITAGESPDDLELEGPYDDNEPSLG